MAIRPCAERGGIARITAERQGYTPAFLYPAAASIFSIKIPYPRVGAPAKTWGIASFSVEIAATALYD